MRAVVWLLRAQQVDVLFELSRLEDQELGSSRDLTWHCVCAESCEIGRIVLVVLVSNFESGDRRRET